MKVLHVITGLNSGGAEAVLTRLVTENTDNRHEVVSLMGEGHYGAFLKQAGIPVHALRLHSRRDGAINLLRLPQLLRTAAADVVQTWMYHADLIGGFAAKLTCPCPVVWGVRCSAPTAERDSSSTRAAAWLCARGSHFVPTKIVSCSREAVSSHGQLGYDLSKFVVVPNGFDCRTLRPDAQLRASLRAELQIADDEFVLGAVGRWHVVKGHRYLLEALVNIAEVVPGRPWRLLLVGTDMNAENRELRGQLDRFGLSERVCLLGSRSDIPQIMNALDILTLPSLGEGFPNVVAEAMACATPCIVSDVGDAALIAGDCGWVVPTKSVSELRKAIVDAMSQRQNAESWSKRRAACRARIEDRFSLQTMVRDYNEVWESVLCQP